MRLGSIEQKISDLIAPSVEELGYEIVRIQLAGEGRGRALQVMIDRADQKNITVEDCTTVSHTASVLLEVDDPIDGAYNLEVSSPGVDRPLTREKDFARFVGFETKIEASQLIDGRKRFRGPIKECVDGVVTIVVDGQDYAVPFALIDRAKLVLTDALIAAHQKSAEATEEI